MAGGPNGTQGPQGMGGVASTIAADPSSGLGGLLSGGAAAPPHPQPAPSQPFGQNLSAMIPGLGGGAAGNKPGPGQQAGNKPGPPGASTQYKGMLPGDGNIGNQQLTPGAGFMPGPSTPLGPAPTDPGAGGVLAKPPGLADTAPQSPPGAGGPGFFGAALPPGLSSTIQAMDAQKALQQQQLGGQNSPTLAANPQQFNPVMQALNSLIGNMGLRQ